MIRWFCGPFNFLIYRLLIISINLKKISIEKFRENVKGDQPSEIWVIYLNLIHVTFKYTYNSYPFSNDFDDKTGGAVQCSYPADTLKGQTH